MHTCTVVMICRTLDIWYWVLDHWFLNAKRIAQRANKRKLRSKHMSLRLTNPQLFGFSKKGEAAIEEQLNGW